MYGHSALDKLRDSVSFIPVVGLQELLVGCICRIHGTNQSHRLSIRSAISYSFDIASPKLVARDFDFVGMCWPSPASPTTFHLYSLAQHLAIANDKQQVRSIFTTGLVWKISWPGVTIPRFIVTFRLHPAPFFQQPRMNHTLGPFGVATLLFFSLVMETTSFTRKTPYWLTNTFMQALFSI